MSGKYSSEVDTYWTILITYLSFYYKVLARYNYQNRVKYDKAVKMHLS